MTPRTTLLIVGLITMSGLNSSCESSGRTVKLNWRSGDVELAGTLHLPEEQGPYPAVIFIPGSGNLTRDKPIFRAHAARLTQMGVAVLLYDKRGCGSSRGDWRTADFNDLADDVVAAAAKLRARPDIRPEHIGLIGHSQGGWIELIAARKDPAIAFLVSLSGPMTTPAIQDEYILARRLRSPAAVRAGLTATDIAEAIELHRTIMQVYRVDRGWDEAASAVQAAESKRWFSHAQLGLQPRTSWNWKWLRTILDVDGGQLVRDCRQPFLGVYGSDDPIVDGPASFEALERIKAERSAPTDAMLLHGADHSLQRRGDAGWPDEYWAKLTTWIANRASE